MDRLQDDLDGVVHLGGLAANRLYLPSRHLARGIMWRGLRRDPAGRFRSYSGDGGPPPLPKQVVERLAQQVLDTGIFLEGQLFELSRHGRIKIPRDDLFPLPARSHPSRGGRRGDGDAWRPLVTARFLKRRG
jgi:hypothetical protein